MFWAAVSFAGEWAAAPSLASLLFLLLALGLVQVPLLLLLLSMMMMMMLMVALPLCTCCVFNCCCRCCRRRFCRERGAGAAAAAAPCEGGRSGEAALDQHRGRTQQVRRACQGELVRGRKPRFQLGCFGRTVKHCSVLVQLCFHPW